MFSIKIWVQPKKWRVVEYQGKQAQRWPSGNQELWPERAREDNSRGHKGVETWLFIWKKWYKKFRSWDVSQWLRLHALHVWNNQMHKYSYTGCRFWQEYGGTKVTTEQQRLWSAPEKWKGIREKTKKKCHLYTSCLRRLQVTVNSYWLKQKAGKSYFERRNGNWGRKPLWCSTLWNT